MISCRFFIFLCIWSHTLINIEGCERPLEVRGVEDYCWTKNVEVIERIHYTGKSVLNFAKKKLGMDVEVGDEPQKCEYYTCIFQELKLLNGNSYPCHEKMTTWIKNNVVYNHATVLLAQVDQCSEGLSNSTRTVFVGDKVGEDIRIDERVGTPGDSQSKCDIVAEYNKCMSLVEKEEKCPIFQYP